MAPIFFVFCFDFSRTRDILSAYIIYVPDLPLKIACLCVGWLREHVTPVILCKDLPACLFSPLSIFPSPLTENTELHAASELGVAQLRLKGKTVDGEAAERKGVLFMQ